MRAAYALAPLLALVPLAAATDAHAGRGGGGGGYCNAHPERCDSDADGLDDATELSIGTDRYNADTDADGLSDGDEVNLYGLDPLSDDTDADGLTDGDELFATGTDPADADTDDDGVSDFDDLFPLDPDEWDDADCDGIGDNADPDDDDDGVDDDLELAGGLPLVDLAPLAFDTLLCAWDLDGAVDIGNPNCEQHTITFHADHSVTTGPYVGEWEEAVAADGVRELRFAFPSLAMASLRSNGVRVIPTGGASVCYGGPMEALGGGYDFGSGTSWSYWFPTGQFLACAP